MLVANELLLLWVALCLTISRSLGNNQGHVCPKGKYWNDFVIGCVQCPKLLKQCADDQIDDANRCFGACNACCPSGTFESDFLSGGCAVCPKKSNYCQNEEYEDSVRCFKACSKLRQVLPTTAPTSHGTSESKTSSMSPPKTVTQSTGIIDTTQGYTSIDEKSGQNWTEITVGILFSVIALFVLIFVGIFFAAYRNVCRPVKSNGDQRSGQDISDPGGETTDAENINRSSITISSVSHEDFGNIPVSQV